MVPNQKTGKFVTRESNSNVNRIASEMAKRNARSELRRILAEELRQRESEQQQVQSRTATTSSS